MFQIRSLRCPKTFSNSLTGNAIWKCFWHCVYTNARERKQHYPKFFPAKSNALEFKISLGRVTSTNDSYHSPIFHTTESSQSLSKWFKRQEKNVRPNCKPRQGLLSFQAQPAATLPAKCVRQHLCFAYTFTAISLSLAALKITRKHLSYNMDNDWKDNQTKGGN